MEEQSKRAKRFLRKSKLKEQYNMRLVSQKRMDVIFIGGLVGLVSLSVLTMGVAFTRTVKPVEAPKVKSVVAKKTDDVDNRLDQFLEGYVSAYFNRSNDSTKQEERLRQLESYYNFLPEEKGTNANTVETNLVSAKLQRVVNKTAIYRVSYEVGVEKTKVTVLFGIPFGGNKGQYYVSGLPYFQAVQSLKASTVDEKEKLNLSVMDDVPEAEREKLKKFLDLFFTNYTTSQENLDVVAKDMTSINGVVFRNVDYTYFKTDKDKITAYVQTSFSIAGMEYSENFTLSMIKKDESYYVEKMEHTIPSDYWR